MLAALLDRASESAPSCAANCAHARRIVSAVRNGLVGRSSEKAFPRAAEAGELRDRVVHPLDVGRQVAANCAGRRNGTSAP